MKRLFTGACQRPFRRACSQAAPDPFALMLGISHQGDFKQGAAQAHTALADLLTVDPDLWGFRFFGDDKDFDPHEVCTEHFIGVIRAAHKEARNVKQIATEDEAIVEMRISEIVAVQRPIPLDTLTVDELQTLHTDLKKLHEILLGASEKNPAAMLAGLSSLSKDERSVLANEVHARFEAAMKAVPAEDRERFARVFYSQFNVRVSVEMFVASPPERWFDFGRFMFFANRVREAENAGEEKNLARLLMISNVYGFFKPLDWIVQKITKSPVSLYLTAVPLDLFKLPTNFFQLPPTVRKVMTFELTPKLNWAVHQVVVDPQFLPFLHERDSRPGQP